MRDRRLGRPRRREWLARARGRHDAEPRSPGPRRRRRHGARDLRRSPRRVRAPEALDPGPDPARTAADAQPLGAGRPRLQRRGLQLPRPPRRPREEGFLVRVRKRHGGGARELRPGRDRVRLGSPWDVRVLRLGRTHGRALARARRRRHQAAVPPHRAGRDRVRLRAPCAGRDPSDDPSGEPAEVPAPRLRPGRADDPRGSPAPAAGSRPPLEGRDRHRDAVRGGPAARGGRSGSERGAARRPAGDLPRRGSRGAHGLRRAHRSVPVGRHRLGDRGLAHGAPHAAHDQDLLHRVPGGSGRRGRHGESPGDVARDRAQRAVHFLRRPGRARARRGAQPRRAAGRPLVLPTFAISRFASASVKVVLSGDGGDELFCGYRRYQAVRMAQALDRAPVWVRRLVAGALGRFRHRRAVVLSRLVAPGNFEDRYRSVFASSTVPATDRLLRHPPGPRDELFAQAFRAAAGGGLVWRRSWRSTRSRTWWTTS